MDKVLDKYSDNKNKIESSASISSSNSGCFENIKELKDLIEYIKSSKLEEVFIQTNGFTVKVKRSSDIYKNNIQHTDTKFENSLNDINSNDNKEIEQKKSNLIEIKSPMIGTFYTSANSEKPPFVKIGDFITKGQTLCIIEAMKLFNEIEADSSGTIEKILVKNSSPVEYDQPLFLIKPE